MPMLQHPGCVCLCRFCPLTCFYDYADSRRAEAEARLFYETQLTYIPAQSTNSGRIWIPAKICKEEMQPGMKVAATCVPFSGGPSLSSSQHYQWKAIGVCPAPQDGADADKKSDKVPLKERAILSWLCHILRKRECSIKCLYSWLVSLKQFRCCVHVCFGSGLQRIQAF